MPIVLEQLNSQTHWGEIDGVTTLWGFTFSGGYILPEHVKAYYIAADDSRIDIPINPELMLVGEFQLEIVPEIPATAKRLVIYRDTPKDLPIVDFEGGAQVTERNLDRIAQQSVFIAAEILDAVLTADIGGGTAVALSDILTRVSALETALGGLSLTWSAITGDPSTNSSLTTRINALIAAAALQVAVQLQDEGSNLGAAGAATTMNFTGAGVTASVAGGVATINIPGGGSAGLTRGQAIEQRNSAPFV